MPSTPHRSPAQPWVSKPRAASVQGQSMLAEDPQTTTVVRISKTRDQPQHLAPGTLPLNNTDQPSTILLGVLIDRCSPSQLSPQAMASLNLLRLACLDQTKFLSQACPHRLMDMLGWDSRIRWISRILGIVSQLLGLCLVQTPKTTPRLFSPATGLGHSRVFPSTRIKGDSSGVTTALGFISALFPTIDMRLARYDYLCAVADFIRIRMSTVGFKI